MAISAPTAWAFRSASSRSIPRAPVSIRRSCLPVTLDVGTNNEELRRDVLYLGYPRRRLEGKAYFDLVEEFVTAVQARYPNVLIQFEDFLTLERLRAC